MRRLAMRVLHRCPPFVPFGTLRPNVPLGLSHTSWVHSVGEGHSSAPIVAAILEKENAVADFRTLIGATNPAEAAPGTIRADFAESISANAVHGSDSDENAAIEGSFFFGTRELA